MPTKSAYVEAYQRDPETGEIMVVHQANGTTEDEGVTITIPNGYLPLLTSTPPEDIKIQIQALPELKTPAGLVSRVDDPEANTSVLVFTLA
jgi:hypothetical protein